MNEEVLSVYALLPLALLVGSYLQRLLSLQERLPTVSLESLWEVVLGAIVSTSLLSVLLLEGGQFQLTKLTLSLAILALILVGASWGKFPNRGLPSNSSWSGRSPVIFLIPIFILGAYLRYPGWSYMLGGQDQGVYLATATRLAREGKIPTRDPLLPFFQGDERGQYIQRNYHAPFEKDGKILGSFQPGLYISDLERNELVPQFYHLHPIWMAIGSWIFGAHNLLLPLGFFGLGSVVVVFLLGRRFGGEWCGISAALLLSVNPAHSYFSKFPVAEIPAGFFFLSGLYLFCRGRDRFSLLMGALTLGCFFLTRITGFFLLPPLLLWFIIRVGKRKTLEESRDLILCAVTTLLLFSWSFVHGLIFSNPYSVEVYARTARLPDDLLQYPLLTILLLVTLFGLALWSAHYFHVVVRHFLQLLRMRGGLLFSCLFGVIICFLAVRGYQLGFTEKYLQHRWFGQRWGMAGHGVTSLTHLSAFTLILFLSPIGAVAFGVGLYRLLKRIAFSDSRLLLGLTTLSYLIILTVVQIATPYLYYYGRYQVSELVPLAILVAVTGVFGLQERLPKMVRASFVVVLIGGIALTNLYPALAHTRVREGVGFAVALERIARSVPQGSVLFIDRKHLAPEQLVLPLREIFQISTYTYDPEEVAVIELQSLAEELRSQGLQVFFLSHAAQQGKLPFLSRVDLLPVNYRLLRQDSRFSLPQRTLLIRLVLVLSRYSGAR